MRQPSRSAAEAVARPVSPTDCCAAFATLPKVKGDGTITREIAIFSLQALNIDQYGLDEIDNKILLTIIDKFRGGPVGISTIATAIGEDSGTVEEVYEPYLIMEGFLKRTPRGRVATQLAYEHLGRNPYAGNVMQPDLFD